MNQTKTITITAPADVFRLLALLANEEYANLVTIGDAQPEHHAADELGSRILDECSRTEGITVAPPKRKRAATYTITAKRRTFRLVANLADQWLGFLREGGDSHERQDEAIELIDTMIDGPKRGGA